MNKLRFYIAFYLAKAVQFLMKLLGRNATYLPGKLASKISKDFLAHLTPPKTVIAVTGTNGKTTVSNLLTDILKENGYSVTNNSFGSNVQAGVISALVEDTTLTGKPKKDIAVLEVDERSSLLVYPYMKPDYLVCNNIMRDSMKRNAHTEFISFIINKALPASTTLILNADDFISSRFGSENQSRVFFGMDAEKPTERTVQHIRDIVYCPKCGETLEAEYIRYNHIGRQFCPACGLKSPTPDFVVTEIDRLNNTFTVQHGAVQETYTLINDNIVNVYNFCGAIAMLHQLGLTYEQISKGFSQSKIVKTRFEEVTAGDLRITMLMSKGQNPIACTRCFDYVAKVNVEDKGIIVIGDDLSDNTNESESTCWIYESDYTLLTDPSIRQIVIGGPRCKDVYLRALLAGIAPEKIVKTEDMENTADLLDTSACKNIFVLHDLSRPREAAVIKSKLVKRGEGGI